METAPHHFAVTVAGSHEDIDLLAETLPFDDHASSAWLNPEAGSGRLDLFFDTETAAEDAERALRKHLKAPMYSGRDFSLRVHEIAHEDWAESWKIHFHALRVSPRLVVRPSWEPVELRDGEHEIVIDPGMTFGTGLHGSTRGCLELLDRLAGATPCGSVLDVGCGSGILSVAAAMLGYRDVLGFDNYGESVGIADGNARVNGVECRFVESDICDFEAAAPYDVVLANVLASVLSEHAPRLATFVAPHGRLVLSGILTEQFDRVAKAYAGCGFTECDRAVVDEWSSGCFTRSSTRGGAE